AERAPTSVTTGSDSTGNASVADPDPQLPVLEGVVVDVANQPVVGATVFVGRESDDWFSWKGRFLDGLERLSSAPEMDSENSRTRTSSGVAGRFAFRSGYGNGRFTLAAIDPIHGIAWLPRVATPAREPLRLVLQGGTILTGFV